MTSRVPGFHTFAGSPILQVVVRAGDALLEDLHEAGRHIAIGSKYGREQRIGPAQIVGRLEQAGFGIVAGDVILSVSGPGLLSSTPGAANAPT